MKTWACRGSAAKPAGRSRAMVVWLVSAVRGVLKATAVRCALLVSRAIDVLHLGHDRVICAYEVDGADRRSRPGLLRRDASRPAGRHRAARAPAHAHPSGPRRRDRRAVPPLPNLQVYVHERGAPHLIDPSKLLESAGRLYGDDMWELWGEVAPVPEERVPALSGGETIEGFRVAYTPGPRVAPRLLPPRGLRATRTSATWPECGSPLRPHVSPPHRRRTSTWRPGSTRSTPSRRWKPQSLGLTHFGRVTDVADHLHRMRCALIDYADAARDGEERFIARHGVGLLDATDVATVECLRAGRAAGPALPGARALLAKEGGMSETIEKPRVGGPGHRARRRAGA